MKTNIISYIQETAQKTSEKPLRESNKEIVHTYVEGPIFLISILEYSLNTYKHKIIVTAGEWNPRIYVTTSKSNSEPSIIKFLKEYIDSQNICNFL